MDEASSDIGSLNSENNENQKLITIGKCSHFYLLILGSGLFKLFSLILLGNNSITDVVLVYSVFVLLFLILILYKVYSFILVILFSE